MIEGQQEVETGHIEMFADLIKGAQDGGRTYGEVVVFFTSLLGPHDCAELLNQASGNPISGEQQVELFTGQTVREFNPETRY